MKASSSPALHALGGNIPEVTLENVPPMSRVGWLGGRVAHAFSPSTLVPEGREASSIYLCEFKISLVYRVSPKTAKATEKTCLKKQITKLELTGAETRQTIREPTRV